MDESAGEPSVDAPRSDEEAERILGVKLLPKVSEAKPGEPEVASDKPQDNPPETEQPQPVRVLPPPTMPTESERDSIQQAIVSAKSTPKPVAQKATVASQTTRARIGQKYVGELTGSIVGNVHCYGYAVHDGIAVYINMGGPKMAVEAMRARLAKGEIVNCTPWDGPAIELTAGEGNTGMYTDFSQHVPEARFQHTILIHEMLLHPNYGGASVTFIIRTSDAQARAKLKHHVTELVTCAVFDQWTDYLWDAGQHAKLVRPTRSGGDIEILSITLDSDAWLRLITGGLEQGVVALPR